MKKLLAIIACITALLISSWAIAEPHVTYYTNDASGTPIVETDMTGAVKARAVHTPYGESDAAHSTTDTSNHIGYTGHQEDPNGLVYAMARYYDPVTGRFLSQDPKGFDQKNMMSFNRYMYANDNPYRFIDPDGKELKAVKLPGLGNTYLDDKFAARVEKFLAAAKENGVNVQVNSAYRTPQDQFDLNGKKTAVKPADFSLHSAGFAIDINYDTLHDIAGGLSKEQQQKVLKDAAASAGLRWGGTFHDKNGNPDPDDPHFYRDPGNRNKLIDDATKKYVELNNAR